VVFIINTIQRKNIHIEKEGEKVHVTTLKNFSTEGIKCTANTIKKELEKKTREEIVNTGLRLVNAQIPFSPEIRGWAWFVTLLPDWSDNRWDGSVKDIKEIICRGVVEYAYEKNGIMLYDGNISHPVKRVKANLPINWQKPCPSDYPVIYSYPTRTSRPEYYCYNDRQYINHLHSYNYDTVLRPSVWEPPADVSITKSEINYENGEVTIEWEKATDKSSGLWGYYYIWDNNENTEPLPRWWHECHETQKRFKLEKGRKYWFHIRVLIMQVTWATLFMLGHS